MRPGEQARLWLAAVLVLAVVVVVVVVSVQVRGLPALGHRGAPASPSGTSGTSTPEPAAPASSLVRTEGDAATGPDSGAVVDVLTRYFTAINDRDFGTWTTTVTAGTAADQPEDAWLRGYHSTADSDVVVTGITPTSTGLSVTLRFVSVQDVTDAPSRLPYGRICWTGRWPLRAEGGQLRVDGPPRGANDGQGC